ncbi:MAG: response regulator, partial [Sulfurimonas sp.]|nr:response regulator [Sulfurimonas sp.]
MVDLKQLQYDAEGFSILHVDDNDALREHASSFLKKFFTTVYTACDGAEGLKFFKKHHPLIVITDIKMPNMSGFELIQNIRKTSLDVKFIVMSAFDDKEYLYQALELGVFRFVKKPVNLSNLTDILYATVAEVKREERLKLFEAQLKSVFNYQSSMIVMFKGSEIELANQMFLTFFGVDSIEDFVQNYSDLGTQFLEHQGFLYNKDNKYWLDEVSTNPQKLFHTKLKDTKGELKHFILKYQVIPEKKDYGILSFDDITELNLLKLYDAEKFNYDANIKDNKSLFKLLRVIQRNNAKVHIRNYYKGLSITNDATIQEIIDNSRVVIKTSYLQQKAIQSEAKSFIVSDALPQAIVCDTLVGMNFERLTVEFKNLHFVASSPTERKSIRIVPQEEQTVSLFLEEKKFHGNVRIEDISLESVKLELDTMPAGLQEGCEVVLDMVLTLNKKNIIINTKATVFKKSENKHSFSVVLILHCEANTKSNLIKYISDRQMNIIRDYKGLQ